MMNPVTANRRHYEDLALGEIIILHSVTITRGMVIDFATEFDPLPFHLDDAEAKTSLLGGLAASGWQTSSLTLRMVVDSFLSKIASMGILGFSNLKWKKPVMAGDSIGGTATIVELRRLSPQPGRGLVVLDFDIRNQRAERVMTMRLNNLVEIRHPNLLAPDGTST